MTSQYQRKISIVVGDAASGKAFDLSSFRCVFNVSQAVVQTPTTCDLKIYNLSPDTVKNLTGSSLFISAGYEGQYGQIFQGNIIQRIYGVENSVDSYLNIIATDSIVAYNNAKLNIVLASGYTDKDIYEAILKSFGEYGITAGEKLDFSPNPHPRGLTLYGDAKEVLRQFADQTGTTWNLSNGRLDMAPLSYAPDEASAIEVNSGTGLIGSPQQTADGITMRVLLNPRIKGGAIGTYIHLNNSTVVNQMKGSSSYATTDFTTIRNADGTQVTRFPSIAQDGFYRVFSASHVGDTRGNPWYTNIIAYDPKAPAYGLPRSSVWVQAQVSK